MEFLKKNKVFRIMTGKIGERAKIREIVIHNIGMVPETRILNKARVLVVKLVRITGADYEIDSPESLKKLFADAFKASKLLDKTDLKAERDRQKSKAKQGHAFPYDPPKRAKNAVNPKTWNGFNLHRKHFVPRRIAPRIGSR